MGELLLFKHVFNFLRAPHETPPPSSAPQAPLAPHSRIVEKFDPELVIDSLVILTEILTNET